MLRRLPWLLGALVPLLVFLALQTRPGDERVGTRPAPLRPRPPRPASSTASSGPGPSPAASPSPTPAPAPPPPGTAAEPATLLLLASGLGVLALLGRRRW